MLHSLTMKEEQLQVLQIADGCYCSSFSLDGEEAFTEWIGGTAILSYKSEMDFQSNKIKKEVLRWRETGFPRLSCAPCCGRG